MRQTAARLNRAWLTIIGVITLIGGLILTAIATGWWARGGRAVGLDLFQPDPARWLFGSATRAAFDLSWVIGLTLVIGVILALLGLGWLLAQFPRSNEAKPFRLHDTAAAGLTRCAPSVLSDAVEAQIEALPGVHHASAVLRGSVGRPDLTVKVTASDRADLQRLVHTVQNRIAPDLGASLDTQVQRLGVQIEIDTHKTNTHQITV